MLIRILHVAIFALACIIKAEAQSGDYDFSCPDSEGFFENPEDCGSYYYCSEWSLEKRFCDNGLHFNKQLKTCVYKNLSGCSEGETSATSVHGAYTSFEVFQPTITDLSVPSLDGANEQMLGQSNNLTGDSVLSQTFNSLTYAATRDLNNKMSTGIEAGSSSEYLSDSITANTEGAINSTVDDDSSINGLTTVLFIDNTPVKQATTISFPTVYGVHNSNATNNLLRTDLPSSSPYFEKSNYSYTDLKTEVSKSPVGKECNCSKCRTKNKESCSKYFECNKGRLTAHECEESLVFNPRTEDCDLPANVKCNSSEKCIDGSGYFPDPEDCSGFLECQNYVLLKKKCPLGLYYDPNKRVCGLSWKTRCGDMGYDSIEENSQDHSVACDCELCIKPDSKDCRKYYLCLNGTAYTEFCDDGLLFNTEKRNCDFIHNVNCQNSSLECKSANGTFKHPTNCSKFLQCVKGTAYEKSCPASLHYNEERNECLSPCEANCDRTLECPKSSTSAICESPNGYFPNHEDCRSFFQCIDGVAKFSMCLENEHFSSQSRRCEDPCIALCDVNLDCSEVTETTTEIGTPQFLLTSLYVSTKLANELLQDNTRIYNLTFVHEEKTEDNSYRSPKPTVSNLEFVPSTFQTTLINVPATGVTDMSHGIREETVTDNTALRTGEVPTSKPSQFNTNSVYLSDYGKTTLTQTADKIHGITDDPVYIKRDDKSSGLHSYPNSLQNFTLETEIQSEKTLDMSTNDVLRTEEPVADVETSLGGDLSSALLSTEINIDGISTKDRSEPSQTGKTLISNYVTNSRVRLDTQSDNEESYFTTDDRIITETSFQGAFDLVTRISTMAAETNDFGDGIIEEMTQTHAITGIGLDDYSDGSSLFLPEISGRTTINPSNFSVDVDLTKEVIGGVREEISTISEISTNERSLSVDSDLYNVISSVETLQQESTVSTSDDITGTTVHSVKMKEKIQNPEETNTFPLQTHVNSINTLSEVKVYGETTTSKTTRPDESRTTNKGFSISADEIGKTDIVSHSFSDYNASNTGDRITGPSETTGATILQTDESTLSPISGTQKTELITDVNNELVFSTDFTRQSTSIFESETRQPSDMTSLYSTSDAAMMEQFTDEVSDDSTIRNSFLNEGSGDYTGFPSETFQSMTTGVFTSPTLVDDVETLMTGVQSADPNAVGGDGISDPQTASFGGKPVVTVLQSDESTVSLVSGTQKMEEAITDMNDEMVSTDVFSRLEISTDIFESETDKSLEMTYSTLTDEMSSISDIAIISINEESDTGSPSETTQSMTTDVFTSAFSDEVERLRTGMQSTDENEATNTADGNEISGTKITSFGERTEATTPQIGGRLSLIADIQKTEEPIVDMKNEMASTYGFPGHNISTSIFDSEITTLHSTSVSEMTEQFTHGMSGVSDIAIISINEESVDETDSPSKTTQTITDDFSSAFSDERLRTGEHSTDETETTSTADGNGISGTEIASFEGRTETTTPQIGDRVSLMADTQKTEEPIVHMKNEMASTYGFPTSGYEVSTSVFESEIVQSLEMTYSTFGPEMEQFTDGMSSLSDIAIISINEESVDETDSSSETAQTMATDISFAFSDEDERLRTGVQTSGENEMYSTVDGKGILGTKTTSFEGRTEVTTPQIESTVFLTSDTQTEEPFVFSTDSFLGTGGSSNIFELDQLMPTSDSIWVAEIGPTVDNRNSTDFILDQKTEFLTSEVEASEIAYASSSDFENEKVSLYYTNGEQSFISETGVNTDLPSTFSPEKIHLTDESPISSADSKYSIANKDVSTEYISEKVNFTFDNLSHSSTTAYTGVFLNMTQEHEIPITSLLTESTTVEITKVTDAPFVCGIVNGFFPKPSDCNAFYLCYNGRKNELKCNRGLHFSEITRHCEPQCKAKCDPLVDCSTDSKEGLTTTAEPIRHCKKPGLFAIAGECNKFLNCTSGITSMCPEGLHFNGNTRTCDWPANANCGARPRWLRHAGRCSCRFCLKFVESDCSKYQLCMNGRRYNMQCSKGLLFDQHSMVCTYASKAKCSQRITLIDTTTQNKKHFKCNTEHGIYPNPFDCGGFVQCSNWSPYWMLCPDNLHFNVRERKCDYPCEAKCDVNLACPPPSRSPTTRNPVCPCSNCLMPSPESCNRYIECHNGKVRYKKCPRGQLFDRVRKLCDWATSVACPHSIFCSQRNGYFVYEKDCHKFIHCSNGIPHVKSCPSGLEFDPGNQRCEWAIGRCAPVQEKVILQTSLHTVRCPKPDGLFASPENCREFIHCSNNIPSVRSCPSSLVFNTELQVCDWPRNFDCKRIKSVHTRQCYNAFRHIQCPKEEAFFPEPDDCSFFYHCTFGHACLRKCPDGLLFDYNRSVCDIPEKTSCNKDSPDGNGKDSISSCDGKYWLIADPTDRKCFYRCINGVRVRGCCSRNRIFDTMFGHCRGRKELPF